MIHVAGVFNCAEVSGRVGDDMRISALDSSGRMNESLHRRSLEWY